MQNLRKKDTGIITLNLNPDLFDDIVLRRVYKFVDQDLVKIMQRRFRRSFFKISTKQQSTLWLSLN